ncbi:MAG: hypothetical protein QF464_06435 [Myxococcota bacterium]|nr:hypothetical protein [Myxococcota bacterium]
MVVAAAVVFGCGGRGGDGSRWVPEDAGIALVAPSAETLRDQLTKTLGGVEGLSGVLDLIEARAGLDLRTRDGLLATGVDPAASLSLFQREGTVGLALGVTHRSRFHARVARQVSRTGQATVQALDGETGPIAVAKAHAEDAPDTIAWSLAWGTGPDAVGLVVWSPGPEAAETWRALAAARRSDDTLMTRATAALAGRAGAFVTATGPPTIPASWGLGPAKVALLPVISGLTAWEGTWIVEPTRTALTLDGRWTTEGQLAADWFQPAGAPAPLAVALPKSQTITARARLNLARLRSIPAFLRKRILPERVPGPLGGALPPVMDLLGLLNGDVSVSILGLDASATVDHALQGDALDDALQLVHAAVLVGVTDPAAARAVVAAVTKHLASSGWFAAQLEAAGWSGVALRSEKSPAIWSIIQRDDVVAVISGPGEVARFVRVAEGTALSLEASADGPVAKGAASSPEVALGLSAGFRRITRELADKGFPPYFLQMVNDLRAISGTLRFRPDGATVDLEVRL